MTSEAELIRKRVWTEAEYLALGETDGRIELIDGQLLVTPPANNAHDDIASRIRDALRRPARAAGLRAFQTPGLRLAPGRIVIPDVAVGRFAYNSVANDIVDP